MCSVALSVQSVKSVVNFLYSTENTESTEKSRIDLSYKVLERQPVCRNRMSSDN